MTMVSIDTHACPSHGLPQKGKPLQNAIRIELIYIALVLLIALTGASGPQAMASDLSNPGFENPGFPVDWIVADAADAVVVTGSEGPQDFAVYADLNLVVEPLRGNQSLRLGSPKQISENQNRGANRVQQTFASSQESLTVALRIFSFEFRGNDRIVIDVNDPLTGDAFTVTDSSGNDFSIQNPPRGKVASCNTTPCNLVMDTGKSGDFLDSGVRQLVIHGLPTDGREITLSYAVVGDDNESHGTWGYFDDTNAAPNAVMHFSPGSAAGSVALEGDFVVFDCNASSDTDGDPLTCTWTATGASIPTATATGNVALFVFPDDDSSISVTLEVSDGEDSDSARTGDSNTPVLNIQNGAPLVNAINLEVLEGSDSEVLCRFLDPGANDNHSASVTIEGQLIDLTLLEENDPSLSSGVARGVFNAGDLGLTPGSYNGVCTISDGVDQGGDGFTVSVLTASELEAREIEDSVPIDSAPLYPADNLHLGTLSSPADTDLSEIRLPDGAALPAGAEVNVTVKVPADFDAILLSRNDSTASTPFVNAPFVNVPFVNAPFVNVPFVNVPFVNVQFGSVPFVNAPFVNVPFVNAPFVNVPLNTSPFVNANFSFSQFPLSQVGLAAPDGGNISGIDIGLGELGSLNLGPLQNASLQVKALSAELGTNTEQMLVKMAPGEQALYLAIVSQDGAFSTLPYQALVEVSTPPRQEQLLGANCNGAELVGSGKTGVVNVLHSQASPKTLIVTQKERLMATFDMTELDFTNMLSEMSAFFDHPEVQARVISVPSTLYDEADRNPCDISLQNDVAKAIKTVIQEQRAQSGSIEYVQLMGSLDIVPPYYSPDETQIGNEGLYASDLWVLPGTPLSVAISEGNNITDAFYVDDDPQPFRGRQLFTEDISVSRLVERPEEMVQGAQSFVNRDGILPFATALAMGYDFFKDGTAASAEILNNITASTTLLNNDSWSADDLRCEYLASDTQCTLKDINVVNAHMTYNAALSAGGFATSDFSDVLLSTETADLLDGKVTVSIGCHSGLSVPDAWAISAGAGLPFDTERDWVQEKGSWVGSWNFAYGDDLVANRGTEGIVTLLLEEFSNGQSLGNALIKAKWRYAAGLFEFGVYDEKSMIALSLFGMPQAKLPVAATLTVGSNASINTNAVSAAFGVLSLSVIEEGSTTVTNHNIEQLTDPSRGTWFTFDGEAQAILGRPLLPTTKPFDFRPLTPGQTRVHGVALRSGTYVDLLDEDPAYSVAKHDWIASIDEPKACVETLVPTQLAVATQFSTQQQVFESLVVQGGQFKCTLATADQGVLPVTGNFRIFDGLQIEALHPSSSVLDSDLIPPTVLTQEVTADPFTNDVTALLEAEDANGVREIIALVFKDLDGTPGGAGIVESYSTGDMTSSQGEKTLLLPNAKGNRLAFQYIDTAGNLLMKSLKGSLIQAIEVQVRTRFFTTAGTTTIVVEIDGFDALSAPTLALDFGDGTAALVNLLNPDGSPATIVAIQNDGSAIIRIDHDYSLFPSDSLTITATVRAQGARGQDSVTLTACGDPQGDSSNPDSDITACSFSSEGTQVSVSLFVDGVISSEFQYRVRLPQTNTLLKWSNGKQSAPGKLHLTTSVISSDGTSADGLQFTFDAGALGWDGLSEFQFMLQTQAGVKKGQSVGFDDETQVFFVTPIP